MYRVLRTDLPLIALSLRLLGGVCTVTSIAITPASAGAPEEVVARLKARHTDFRRLEIRWTALHFVKRGALSSQRSEWPQPLLDASHKLAYRAVLDEESIRLERNGPFWSVREDSFVDAHLIQAYDSTTAILHNEVPFGEYTGTGYVFKRTREAARSLFSGDWQFDAFFLAFRPLNDVYSNLQPDLNEKPTFAEWQGENCLVFERRIGDALRLQSWINVNQGVVVRQRRFDGARTRQDLIIKYENRRQVGLVPCQWQFSRFHDLTGAKVESYHVVDIDYDRMPEITDDLFTASWKPGMLISDGNASQRYSIVNEDGSLEIRH
ncbi:MAG: hypothetical protein AAF961_09370 [Planctomycetota bacterium]